jgi:DNA polymerase I-like protein with 3'-5' exonuclease and polymerase domains
VLRPDGRHNLELFRHDFKELLLDKEKKNVEPTYKEIRTIEEMNAWYENERHALKTLHKAGLSCIYSLDTEGVSLEVEHDELLCLQISRVIGVLDPETKHFTPEEIPQEVDLLIFRENINPEFFAAALFEMESAQMDMFGDSEVETSPKKAAAPVFAVANSEEERKQIIAKHGTKKEARPLEIFTPYKRKQFLAKHEPEVGEIFNSLSVEKGCAGFVLTNANYDRIRLQRFLNWDLSLPGMRGGFDFPLDTMLAEHCLDESSDLGLKPCLNKHFNWPRQDTQLDAYAEAHKLTDIRSQIENEARRSEWSLYPWEVLRPYAAKDAYGTAALLAKQLKDIDAQVERYQGDRVDNNPNTLLKAFHIQCGAIDATYEMMTHGMPLGDKGIKILDELTSFYRSHESRMVSEYQDTVYRLTGLSKANPSSPEELSYVLFAENSPLRKQGIEPWKESGKNGRLWSEIPPEERGSCTPSTDAESLEIIASNCPDPEIQKFLLRLSETKTILTIRQNFLSDEGSGKGLDGRINRHTKCMHTSYTPTLDTNRCRSLPNLSTFPKMEGEMVKAILGEAPPYQIRQIVQAPPGTFLLNRDWTTAEVLGLGYLSQDRNMLEIISRLSDGMDFHCKLAVQTYASIRDSFAQIEASPNINKAWIEANFPEKQAKGITGIWEKAWSGEGWGEIAKQYGINDKVVGKSFDGNKPKFSEEAIHQIVKSVFKQMRSNIKPVTFGVPYGREALAIQKQLNREYYVNNVLDSDGKLITVSLEEAQAMIDSYKTGFPDAWGYLVSQADHAKERGFLRDHWGYIRHFPKGMKEGEMTRKAYNYQIQHIVAVLMNQAMQDWIRERHQRKLRSYAYTTLYDNIGWVVHEDELQDVWDISMRVMTSERPVGPLIGEIPELFNCHIPTDGELSYEWEGKLIDPTSLGINTHPELNLTGLEGKY